MLDKYQLTRNESVFLAKKELVSNIYNSAKLEGIDVTYQDTKTILDGVNVPSMKLDEINCILNLRDAWQYLMKNINQELSVDYICQINSYVSRNESLEWGKLRTGKVGIRGAHYIPEIPDKGQIESQIKIYLKQESKTKAAIELMLYLMRTQMFWDGNKRTSMLIANKIMIENGCGIISIKEEYINDFNKLLTEYYNSNDMKKITQFIYDKCIYGIDKD